MKLRLGGPGWSEMDKEVELQQAELEAIVAIGNEDVFVCVCVQFNLQPKSALSWSFCHPAASFPFPHLLC